MIAATERSARIAPITQGRDLNITEAAYGLVASETS
jgi:hypothetical protein